MGCARRSDVARDHTLIWNQGGQKQFNVPTIATGIITAASWIYTVGSYSAAPYSVNIETGQAIRNTAAFSMTGGSSTLPWMPSMARDGTSPNDVKVGYRPAVTRETDSPYLATIASTDTVWFAGLERIYTGCGTVFRASTIEARHVLHVLSA
jgi:hypothetical protein